MSALTDYLTYRRAYRELSHQHVSQLALESWREYISTRGRIYDMDFCRAYQHAFIHQYRRRYALSRLQSAQ